jgi:hypothetical protein
MAVMSAGKTGIEKAEKKIKRSSAGAPNEKI